MSVCNTRVKEVAVSFNSNALDFLHHPEEGEQSCGLRQKVFRQRLQTRPWRNTANSNAGAQHEGVPECLQELRL